LLDDIQAATRRTDMPPDIDLTTLDRDDPDPDDLRSFTDYEVDQLHSPWDPPPGDRMPSRKEWTAMSRVDRYRWRVAFGEDWTFGAPRGPRTAEDWKKLPDDQRTPDVFNALSRAAKEELQDEGLDPTTLQAPVRVTEGNEDVDEPAPISDEDFRPIEPGDEMYDHVVARRGAEVEQLLRRLDGGDFESVPLDSERIAVLRAQAAGPDSPERGEAVQRLAHILQAAQARTLEAAPFVVRETSYQNRGAEGIRTIERSTDGRERVVGVMTAEEVSAALAAEEAEAAGEIDDPGAVTLEQVARWPQDVRMRFLDKHPVEYEALLRAGSAALEE
jgi:hypothetical protein